LGDTTCPCGRDPGRKVVRVQTGRRGRRRKRRIRRERRENGEKERRGRRNRREKGKIEEQRGKGERKREKKRRRRKKKWRKRENELVKEKRKKEQEKSEFKKSTRKERFCPVVPSASILRAGTDCTVSHPTSLWETSLNSKDRILNTCSLMWPIGWTVRFTIHCWCPPQPDGCQNPPLHIT
jgi:hypothetical protein